MRKKYQKTHLESVFLGKVTVILMDLAVELLQEGSATKGLPRQSGSTPSMFYAVWYQT